MPAPQRLAIAQVTPFAWEVANEVNEYVARVSDELAARGHHVLIVAPSESAALVRDSRRTLRSRPEELLGDGDSNGDSRDGEGAVRVLGVGEVLPFAPARRRTASLPVDVARTIEEALTALPLDIVNVHEPFAPSASSAALRHSRALNVGSFHAPTERVLSTQLTGPLSRLLFSRMDARTASYAATRNLLQHYFPGEYTVIAPGADVSPERAPAAVPEIVMIATEERAALRIFLRTLRTLPPDAPWHATVWYPRPTAPPATLPRLLRERVTFVEASERNEAELLRSADIAVFASEGLRATPGTLVRALGAGAVPVASRLPAYEEVLGDGECGFMFEPGETATLTAHLQRLVAEPDLRERANRESARRRQSLGWGRVASELEAIYLDLAGRRREEISDTTVRARLASRPLIDVDLHMHTDHSYDCATPVEVLLAEARTRGLGAIAVTDHNEISGALEARAKANGIKVIVGEEVKTKEQGEVIGLFIEEKIPRGMTLQQTIDEIKRQGGVVYVPHPFDRMHSVPDYEHLLAVIDDVDAIEVFNPRIAISEFNEEAVRFAAKYRIPAGAGSDAHVPQGLGSVRIRMRDFNGPEEFLESLRDADIIRNPASLLYVQALKFLQTKAMPGAARRASRERRVRRATGRKS
ncbi:MAG TPA: PHP-associated domain-containing protein [Solirubrobacteraceae bacterium]|nr:PHP-associated domain-containing protein [Solirubrobacteraceae bacterium]